MSKELELLQEALEWMHELKYVWANVRDSGDYDLLELIAGINKIERILAQPEPEPEPRKPLNIADVENHLLLCDVDEGYIDGYIDGMVYAEREHKIRGRNE